MRASPRSTYEINAAFYANEDAIVKAIEFGTPLREIAIKYNVSRCALTYKRAGIPWSVARALYARVTGGKLNKANRGPTAKQRDAILKVQAYSYNNGKEQQATAAGVSVSTVYEWVSRGYIPNVNRGKWGMKSRYGSMAKEACSDLSRRQARMCVACGFCLYCSAKRRMKR